VALFGYHSYLYLVYNGTEVLRTWEENHPRFYWTPYDKVDVQSLDGFPLRSGWKVVGSLYDQGVIDGDFESNHVSYWVMGWYTRAHLRCASSADWFFLIDPLHPWSEDPAVIEERLRSRGYAEWGRVTVRGEPRLWIYRRGREEDAGGSEARTFALEEYTASFDAGVTQEFPLDYPIVEARIGQPLHVNLDNQVWLEGYDLALPPRLEPGGKFRLTLYWRGQKPFERDYKVFNQVVSADGVMAAQKDGHPVCDRHVTTRWLPGALISDVYEIEVNPDTPPSTYPLNTGMYLDETFERLSVLDEAGNPVNNQVHITDIKIEGSSAQIK
jgi:hypothetical protein